MKKKKSAKPRGGPGRLSAENAARLPDRLLDAAQELFNERTFADTTMEEVARRAGASTKTLYARYAGKAELMQAVVNRIIERSMAAAAAAVPLDPSRTDPRTFILALGTQMVTSMAKEGAGLISIALSEARRFPAIAKMYDAAMAHGLGTFGAALARWHADGLLPGLKNPERAARLLISMLSDTGRIRTAMGQPMSDAEIAAHIPFATDLFLRGMGYRPNK
jgi:AcrR family transcriptional regulator